MRFRFNGFGRDTGKAIIGHVEASDAEAAYQVLSERGIITVPAVDTGGKTL